MPQNPQVGSVLQQLTAKGLVDRLPVTFSTFFFDRIREWDLLFPAEKNYYERLFALLDRSDTEAVAQLFAPLREIEKRMGVNEKTWPTRQFTLAHVDFLNRSPHYNEWRSAIARIFSEIDPLLDAELAQGGHSRMVIVACPAELPVGPDRMWLRLRNEGKLVDLDLSDDTEVEDYLPLLLTGAKRKESRPTLMELYAGARAKSLYDVWLTEARSSLFPLVKNTAGWVQLSYDRLQGYRTRLMAEVRKMVETQDIRGPRQLGEQLKKLKAPASVKEIPSDPALADFVRSVLLNGNGTLLINNTFVQWAAIQGVRRARPSLAVVSFGIRNKLKPFSGLLIYTDQESSNPIPTQMDMLGSYIDLEILNYYIWLECEKYAEYRRNTAYLMVGEGMDRMLVIAPPDFPLLAATQPVRLTQVFSCAKEWLSL